MPGAGLSCRMHRERLVRLAEQMLIPVTTTLMGLGAVPGDHPLNLGMLGMHGTEYANFAVTECDLLIAIGVRFDDRVTGKLDTFAPHAKIIHIDIDPAEIGKNKKVDVPIVGDVGSILGEMLHKLQKTGRYQIWLDKIKGWKKKHPLRFKDDGKSGPSIFCSSYPHYWKVKA